MTPSEFYAWLETQPCKFELVAGKPVMLPGRTIAEDEFIMNARRVFSNSLLNKTCRPRGDVGVRTCLPRSKAGITPDGGNIRFPGLSVDYCINFAVPTGVRYAGLAARRRPQNTTVREAEAPALVFEVSSITQEKLDEYRRLDTLKYVLVADLANAQIWLYERFGKGWGCVSKKRGDQIELPEIGIEIPVAELMP